MATLPIVSLVEAVVPELGDVKNAPVIEVLARVGEPIALDGTLVVIETEKAAMDVPSTIAGIVRELRVKVGDKIGTGSLLALIEPTGGDVREAAKAAAAAATLPLCPAPVHTPEQADTPAPHVRVPSQPAPRTAPQPASQPASQLASQPAFQPTPPSASQPAPAERTKEAPPAPASPSPAGELPHASPSVRRFAREFGIDLAQVRGSGPKGRILHSDLQEFVKAVVARIEETTESRGVAGLDLLPWPQVDFARFGPIDRVDLSKIRKISGANLTRNAVVIPHVTNFDEVDVTELEAFRTACNKEEGREGVKLTMLAFLIKASVAALREHPHFNASLDGEQIVLKRYFHIGFAADTPNGLVVPVVRDADTKGLRAIAAETAALAEQARAGKLKSADMQGGSFTVSSLGGIGGTGFTPIINAPEVAILGAARAGMKPVWDGEQFRPRLVLPLSLSWDHRVIDGAAAARFLVTLTRLLADFRRVIL